MRLLFFAILSWMVLSVSAIAAPPLETYGKLPALDLVRLSPSGNKIAFIAVDGENRKLFIRQTGGDALLVAPVGTTKIRDLEWAGEDNVIITASVTFNYRTGGLNIWQAPGKTELGFLFLASLKTGHVTRLLGNDQTDTFDGAAISLGPRNIDGQWWEFVRTFNRRMGSFVYEVNLDTLKGKPVTSFEGANEGYDIDGGGRIAAHAEYIEDGRNWSLYVGASGRSLIVQRKSDLDTLDLLGNGRTPGAVLIKEADDTPGGTDAIDEYPVMPGASPTRLFSDPLPDRIVFDPLSHLAIGGILPRGQGAVFFDPKLQKRYDAARKAFPGLQVELASASTDFSRMVVKTDGGDDPGTYWLVDMNTGKADDLMAAYPIDTKDVGLVSVFQYKAADGQNLEGILTLPAGTTGKELPLVVIPHGGPVDVYDQIKFDYWPQAFASRGYAVFQPNYRGSGGYGAAFRQAGFGQYGEKMLTDISDGVAALASAGVIDPAKVCIAGASWGGYAALAEVTFEGGHYRCAVAVSPVSNPAAIMVYHGDNPETPMGRYIHLLFGSSFSGAAGVARISPLRHADMADAPILLIHGKDDSTVPFEHSKSMLGALQSAGKVVQLDAMESEDHYWSHEATRQEIIKASVAWVEKYDPVQ